MKNALLIFVILGFFQMTAKAQLSVSIAGPDNSPGVCSRQLTANVSGGSGNYSYTWGTTNSCTPTNNVNQTLAIACDNDGVAYVFVTDNVTGNFVRSANVSFKKIIRGPFSVFIPNVFTPNADGYNDYWAVFDANHGTGPLNAYGAYFKWAHSQNLGNPIFEATVNPTINPNGVPGGYIAWDGGNWISGSYFAYTVTLYNCNNTQTYNGNFTLIK